MKPQIRRRRACEVSLITMRAVPILACLLVASIAAGCRKGGPEPELVRPVRVVTVGDSKAILGREFPGRAKATREVDLSFRVAGPLVSLPVDVGARVKQADVIAVIDPRDFQTSHDSAEGNLNMARAVLAAMEHGARPEQLEQLKAAVAKATADYRQAEADYQRAESLLPTKGAITREQYDQAVAARDRAAAGLTQAKEDLNIGLKGARIEDIDAKRAEIKALQAAVENAKNQLDYTTLRAPFDGVIAAKYVHNFETVQAKQPIVRLLDVSKIEVTVQVPESLIAVVPRVKKVTCRFDAFPGREFAGRPTKIGAEASTTTRTYPVTIAIDQPDDVQILPGMAAIVRAEPEEGGTESNDELVVPPSALFTDNSEQGSHKSFVWVVPGDGGPVSRRSVTPGDLTPVGIAVREGLKAGECVVTAGVHSLREGQRVRIAHEGSR